MYRCVSCHKLNRKTGLIHCEHCGSEIIMHTKENEGKFVIGNKGKIGKAISDIFCAHLGIDIGDEFNTPFNVGFKFKIMHVCIPTSNKFTAILTGYVKQYSPSIVIIHSTIPVGLTRKLEELLGLPVVHIPVHGHHTDGIHSPVSMTKDMYRYILWVGATKLKTGNIVCDYVGRYGFKAELYSPETTEFAKIMSTNLIKTVIESWAWHNNIASSNHDISWDAVTRLIDNIAQNEPYGYLNRVFQRPGPIDTEMSGKHCLTENSRLL